MTRKEAIIEIVCTWGQRDQEFCVGTAEQDASDNELNAALEALGVTAEECNAAFTE